jgi:hypothetical protein
MWHRPIWLVNVIVSEKLGAFTIKLLPNDTVSNLWEVLAPIISFHFFPCYSYNLKMEAAGLSELTNCTASDLYRHRLRLACGMFLLTACGHSGHDNKQYVPSTRLNGVRTQTLWNLAVTKRQVVTHVSMYSSRIWILSKKIVVLTVLSLLQCNLNYGARPPISLPSEGTRSLLQRGRRLSEAVTQQNCIWFRSQNVRDRSLNTERL